MTSPIVTWLLTLISGTVGGNIGAALIKDQTLGPVVNTILGLVGGVGGSQLLGGLGGLNASAGLTTSGRPELSEHCCQSSLHLEEQVCEGMMRAVCRIARSGNRIYVGQ
jgi:uncharacterized membrane protein YeaQ/YmgE (transglycosylase-associated protein family)